MHETITLTKASFISLLDSVLNPNPDDPEEPRGPIGPVVRDWLLWFLVNRQPLPPFGPQPEPWRFGPQPQPWRSAFLARAVIDRAVAQYQFAEALAGTEQSERITAAIGSQIREFVDDYCGTRPPRWPRPWPWPANFDPAQLHPLDLLIAGAQFQKAADLAPNNPLQADFSTAANQLFETGLKRMESGCS